MATILSNGFEIPNVGERGSAFYPMLERNIQRTNDHEHNGSDSELVNSRFITKNVQAIPASGWSAVSGQSGTYRQSVALPFLGMEYATSMMKFIIDGGSEDGALVHPTIEKISDTSFYVYINDNSLSLKVIYG